MGDREEQAEEHGQPRAPPVVVELEPDRMGWQLPHRPGRGRICVRIAVGDEGT